MMQFLSNFSVQVVTKIFQSGCLRPILLAGDWVRQVGATVEVFYEEKTLVPKVLAM